MQFQIHRDINYIFNLYSTSIYVDNRYIVTVYADEELKNEIHRVERFLIFQNYAKKMIHQL